MAENLNYGTMISAKSSLANDSIEEKYCYSDLAGNCQTDGALYTWAEALALPSSCNNRLCKSSIRSPHRGLCPIGWHVPSKQEWIELGNYLGATTGAGLKMKRNNTSFAKWDQEIHNDGNSSGFSAFPTGYLREKTSFFDRTIEAHFWTATEQSSTRAYRRTLKAVYGRLFQEWIEKANGFSLRCIQDR